MLRLDKKQQNSIKQLSFNKIKKNVSTKGTFEINTGLEGRDEKGSDNPLQYSCLGNPTEEPGGLQSMGSQKSWTQFSD